MTEGSGERLELTGSLPQTVTWVYIGDDGRLTIEWYDYSDEAESMMGGDVAFLLYVDAAGKHQIGTLLEDAAAASSDAALLRLLQQRFGNYHEIKAWLIAQNVPFEAAFDGNA